MESDVEELFEKILDRAENSAIEAAHERDGRRKAEADAAVTKTELRKWKDEFGKVSAQLAEKQAAIIEQRGIIDQLDAQVKHLTGGVQPGGNVS